MIGQETVNEFSTGGSHRVNPFRGIPIGGNNRAEEEETSVEFPDGKYIFSNKLFINNIDDTFPMKLPDDISFSEASEYIGKQFEEGGNKIDSETEMEILVALRYAQDTERNRRGIVAANEFSTGGAVEQVENRMQAANMVSTGLMAAGAIPSPASPFLLAGGAAVKIGTEYFGGKAMEGAIQQAEDADSLIAKQQTEVSPFGTKIFPDGGLVIPQDSTRINTVNNAYQDSTVRQTDMIEPLNFTIPQIQDTTSLPQFNIGGIKEFPFGTNGTLTSIASPTLDTSNAFNFNATTLNDINTLNPSFGSSGFSPASQSITDIQLNNGIESGGLKRATTTPIDPDPTHKPYDPLGKEGKIGEAIKLAAGLGSSIAGLASTKREDNVPRYDISQQRNPNTFYNDEIRRAINRTTQTQTQALANRSAGNIGAFSSNVAAIGQAGSQALGQSFVQQQQINNKEYLDTDTFNFRQRAIQARSDREADNLDAANEGAFQNQRNAYRDAIYANVGSFGESLSAVGRGNKYLEELTKFAQLNGLKIPGQD